MKQAFLIVTPILACLLVAVGDSYAWPIYPDVYVCPGEFFAAPGQEVSIWAGVSSGGPIETWEWDWEPGTVGYLGQNDSGEWSVSYGSYIQLKKYWIDVNGTDYWRRSDSDYAYLYVFEMDLSMDGLPEESETTPGAFIGVGESVPVSIDYAPSNLHSGYEALKVDEGGCQMINVFEGDNKVIGGPSDLQELWRLRQSEPGDLTVRGMGPGYATLTLTYCKYYDSWYYDCSDDIVKITVVQVDLDIDAVPEDSEETIGAFVPLGCVVPLSVGKAEPLSTGEVTLKVSAGGGKIRLWQNPDKTGPITLPATFDNATYHVLYVEGIEASDTVCDITLVEDYTISDKTFDDKVKLTVYTVESVEWEEYLDNEDLSSCPAPNGGYRIFPDKTSFADQNADQRKLVRVKASIKPVMDNKYVYFSCWDVDDPSSDGAPIDFTDVPPGNIGNGADNYGGCGGLYAESVLTNASGIARVTFTASMAPGDNFKVAASTNVTKVRAYSAGEMTQAMADGKESLPQSVVLSPMLTVWRRIWIEQDSMAAVGANSLVGFDATYPQNPGSGQPNVELNAMLSSSDFREDDHFDYGYYAPFPTTPYRVDDTVLGWIFDSLRVNGDPYGDGASSSYVLWDDDYDQNMQLRETLPASPSLDSGVFDPVYIVPFYLTEDYDVVPFDRNLEDGKITRSEGTWCSAQSGKSNSSSFWYAFMVTAYQGDAGHDMDPDTEFGHAGSVNCSTHWGAVFVETAREGWDIKFVLQHEIGHTLGVDTNCDNVLCNMKEGLTDTICDQCKNYMRSHAP